MHGSGDPDDLVTALLSASRALVAVSARSLAAVEDTVTLTQFRTLVVLTAHGPSRLVELAGRLGVNASTAQRSVERLVAAGLVDRRENTADRREVVIEPTAAGTRLVNQVTRRRRAAIDEIVRAMPASRRHRLVEALEAFAAAAGELREGPDDAGRLGW
jgi:DNA-binding MarR family transcriptional regulator